MSLTQSLDSGAPGIIAILRGVRPEEVLEIGSGAAGRRHSHHRSAAELAAAAAQHRASRASFGERALIGAGTVLSAAQVRDVAAAGGRLIVSPNMDRAVVEQTLQLGLESLPGRDDRN